ARRSNPFRREIEWIDEVRRLREEHFPQLRDIALARYRRVGLYPEVDAPEFSRSGGRVEKEFPLAVSSSTGQVYYTVDGEDPREPDGSVSLNARLATEGREVEVLSFGAPVRVEVPAPDEAVLGDWIDPDFDDATWTQGTSGVGFETTTGYEEFIGTDVRESMFETSSVVRIRMEFFVDENLPRPELWMQYDDGFVAYLNGIEIARDNAPEALGAGATATAARADNQSRTPRAFPFPGGIELRRGRNVLALVGLNVGNDNSDFLIVPTIRALGSGDAGLSIAGTSTVRARTLDGGDWSALVEARFYGTETKNLRITEFMYHPPRDLVSVGVDSDEYEFIEIANLGEDPVPLRGVRLAGEVSFEFADDETRVLSPGEPIVLVGTKGAFLSRYDVEEGTLAGEFRRRLSNAGGSLALYGPLGDALTRFDYDDAWHPESDGEGRSLVAVDPTGPAEALSGAEGWRVSSSLLGSPGVVDSNVEVGQQRTGDLNQDASVDISDAIALLGALFLGSPLPPPCEDVALDAGANLEISDCNGDGSLDLSDGVFVLVYLFRGGPTPAGGELCRGVAKCPSVCVP
ncbi:MAG: hypothetical protein AAF517_27645, partial [Planctomycetota bacterium]